MNKNGNLVLPFRVGQKVKVGEAIITVIDIGIKGTGIIRLGFEAPQDVKIERFRYMDNEKEVQVPREWTEK